ncbi:MAG: hypothetical protein M3R51_07755 [Candidatus Eremiobacteraeota bacterium]|nr:hypothetical protein [Candidatus Eremiobacteraeota bacterium]
MLALVLLIATLTTPLPSAAPSASAGPLKEIIHVHSTSLCDEFDSHINAAIGSATRNDLSLAGLVSSLSLPQTGDDLNDNGLRRHRAIDMLVGYADGLTADYKRGEAEVRYLRDLADRASTSDPQQKVAMRTSADLLGGALWRQRLIARDLDGFVAYLYAEEMRWGDRTQMQGLGAISPEGAIGAALADQRARSYQDDVNGRADMLSALPGRLSGPADDRMLTRNAARDFKDRLSAITTDESNAAASIVKAGEHC